MNIRLDTLDDDIYQLTFDRPDSSANIFDRATIEELDQHLNSLAGDTQMRGLVIVSAKKSIFIAGADINELLAKDLPEVELKEMVRRGQQVFSRVAALRVPTVAAIHGACLGGGLELCLACDYRIASEERATRIGFPETHLGILPGWGGSTRLPRLIGLPKALDVILKGKRLAARQALKYGVIDQLVPREHFARIARAKIAQGKPTRPSHRLTNNALVARLVASRVAPDLEKKTHGHYPAVPRALDVVTQGIGRPVEYGLSLEADAITELARTETCKNLVRVFFLQERAKGLRLNDLTILGEGAKSKVEKVKESGRAAVIGAGVMGAGIAQWISARGRTVILRDISSEQVGKGMATVGKLYRDGVKRHLFSRTEARQGVDRIIPSAVDVPLNRVDVVIEAAVENMDIKKQIFKGLVDLAGEDTVLATNTSALSISELGDSAGAAERVIGIHFFNPVHRMQLVEIVVGEKTTPAVVDRTLRFVQGLGKMPVVVKDRPGFVVNRILMPYLTEAGHLFSGGASVADIDGCMLDFGMPMGPLRLIDEVGVDVANHVATFFGTAFGDRMPVPEVLAGMMEGKWMGRKSGAGFYRYGGKKGDTPLNEEMSRFVKEQGFQALSRENLQERMVFIMLNEAARCFEEGIVSSPADIDFAMIMGTGFAPFRGGPLRYADAVGVEQVVAGLDRLAEKDNRFAPCDLLLAMQKDQKRFYQEG